MKVPLSPMAALASSARLKHPGPLVKAPAASADKTPFSALIAPSPRATSHAPPKQPNHESPTKPTKEARTKEPDHEEREPRARRAQDELDPDARRAAQLAPPAFVTAQAATPTAESAPAARAHASLEDLVPQLVRKIAWTGDGKRGSVRMELGAGDLAGSVLVVHSDAGKVRVELAVPAGVDRDAWRERLTQRLGARGIDLESIEVT